MITLTAKIASINQNNNLLTGIWSNYAHENGYSSINQVLKNAKAKKPFVSRNITNENGEFAWTGVINRNFEISQNYTYFRYSGSTETEYMFDLFGEFSKPSPFIKGDNITFNKIILYSRNKEIILSYPNNNNPLMRIDPFGIGEALEGFQIMLYINIALAEEQGLEFSQIEELLKGSTFYFEGSYERYNNSGNCIITVSTDLSVDSFWISFGIENNSYPTKLTVDGVEYYPNNPTILFNNLESLETHTIELIEWNLPNAPLIIYGVYKDLKIDINSNNIKSLNCSIYDRSDLKLPSWGIISNTGNIEFSDYSSVVLSYVESLELSKDLLCEILLTDTLTNKIDIVGTFETDQWNYDNDNKVVSLTLKDDLQEWQEINVEAVNYNPQTQETKTAKWFFEYLWRLTSKRYDRLTFSFGNGNYNFVSFSELDEKTQTILESITIKYPLLEAGTLWSSWNKLCQLCQAHIYKDRNGIIRFQYNWGN